MARMKVSEARVARLMTAVMEAVDQHGSQAKAAKALGVNQGLISWVLNQRPGQVRFSPTLEDKLAAAGLDVGADPRVRMVAELKTQEDKDLLTDYAFRTTGLTWTELVQDLVNRIRQVEEGR